MRYAISYISTADINLNDQGVDDIMKETNIFNQSMDITGILLYNEMNFFQLIEGEKQIVEELYKKIIKDPRHKNIIKFLEKPVINLPFDGYLTDFITDTKKCDESKLKFYLHYIEVLNPESQNALKKVMQLMLV